jgi:hypothetical protein
MTTTTDTAYRRLMLVATAYTAVPCPRCKAPAGSWCTSVGRHGRNGYQNSGVRHRARHALVAGWDDERRLAESERAGVFRTRTTSCPRLPLTADIHPEIGEPQ